ncbi:MAG: hypothetical protein MZU95_00750 [Desulfomicrobium escambiense]|nr:hypothetical protein [Desulfomicrobium escambiense]
MSTEIIASGRPVPGRKRECLGLGSLRRGAGPARTGRRGRGPAGRGR